MLVSKLKESNLPKDFLDILPNTCSDCGEKLMITESLTRLHCNNPTCSGKVVNRLQNLLNALGIDYVTRLDCMNFIEKYDLKNHLAIFDYIPSVDGELYDGFGERNSDRLYTDLNKCKDALKLWEYIKLANLYSINEYEKYIFINYDNIDNFYEDLYSNGVGFIELLLKNRGTMDTIDTYEGTSIRAYNIYRELLDYEKVLREYVNLFNFIRVLNTQINLNIGVIGDLDSPMIREIKDEFSDNMDLSLSFTNMLDTSCVFILDTEGLIVGCSDRRLSDLYKDTMIYERVKQLDTEVLTFTECKVKVNQVLKMVGRNNGK